MGSQSANTPFVTPVPVQLLDSSGRAIQSGKTSLYTKKDESTWSLDAQQQYGPKNLHFFAQLLAFSGDEVQGVFTANNATVPPGWALYPSDISGPFRRYVLVPDSSGTDAQFYFQSILHGSSMFQIGIYMRPTSELGATFFADPVFARFRNPSRWLSIPLENDKPIDSMFTPLDFNRLVPTSTQAKFHVDGETREHWKQLLANTKFLFTVASQQDATLMPARGPSGSSVPLLIIGIDWILQALEESRLQTEWPSRSIPHTSLVLEIFESLLLVFVNRQMAFISSHASLAEVTPFTVQGTPSHSVLMMNPASSQHVGAPTIIQASRRVARPHAIEAVKLFETPHGSRHASERRAASLSFSDSSSGGSSTPLYSGPTRSVPSGSASSPCSCSRRGW